MDRGECLFAGGDFFLEKSAPHSPGELLKDCPGNQKKLGDLVTTNVNFSKQERRTVNKDKQFLGFITA